MGCFLFFIIDEMLRICNYMPIFISLMEIITKFATVF